MRDKINLDINTDTMQLLRSMNQKDLWEFFHKDEAKNESSEQSIYDVKETYNSPSREVEEETDAYNKFELTEESEESKDNVKKFFKGTPKPSKNTLDYDYDCDEEEGFDEIDIDSQTSNPYNLTQDTSPCFLKTRYSEYTAQKSSNTTTVLSSLGNNNFNTPCKAISQNTTANTPQSASSSATTGTNSTGVGYYSDQDEISFMAMSSSKYSNGTVNVIFSRERLRTAFANQEDHNTAYELFVRFCITQSTGYKVRHVPHVISAAFSSIMTEHAVTAEIENELNALQLNKERYRSIKEDQKLRDHALKGVRGDQITIVEKFVQSLAEKYSCQTSVVHPKTGNKGLTHGNDVSAAIASLKVLDEFNDLRSKLETSDDQKILFAKECLAVNGRLVRGMRRIYDMYIPNIRNSIGLDTDVGENDDQFDVQKATELFNYLDNKSRDYNLIGGLIENCFDFPKTQYESKGRRSTRNVELDELSNAANVVIIMTSGSFPHVDINNAIPSFLDYVSINQGWGLNKEKIDKLTTSIRESLDTWKRNKEAVLYNKNITKKAEVTPAHICLNEGRITKKRKNSTKENTNVKKGRSGSINDILALEVCEDEVSHTHRYQTRSKNPMSLRK